METYLLKSSISLIVLYGLYKIMLRYEFNHQLNRFIGLACVLFSITFPLMQFSQPQTELPGTVYMIATATTDFQENVSSVISSSTPDIILLVYYVGAGFFLLRVLIGLVTLARYYLTSAKRSQWGFTVVTVDKKISPFTFFNILFVGNNNMESSEMDVMLVHEQVHRNQFHSIDAVVLEVLKVVFWFNPAMWFFQKDIKAEHEYIADGQVLNTGTDHLTYQFILFKARTGTSMELGSYLSNKTSLTKRFNMMTKTNLNRKGSYARALIFLPLMSVILFLGAFSNEAQPDKNATYKEGDAALVKTVQRQLKYPTSARKENRSGLVWVSFTVDKNGDVKKVKAREDKQGYFLKEIVVVGYASTKPSGETNGVDDVLRAEGVRVVKTLGKFDPAQKNGRPVSSVVSVSIKFLLE